MAFPSQSWRAAAVTVALLACSCRCGEPPAERAFEAGAPLGDLPASRVHSLAQVIPARATWFVSAEDPLALASQVRSNPRLARLADPELLSALALSDAGATTRTLAQRLNELSQNPVAGIDLGALLEGPVAAAARSGPGGTELLVVKRLSPAARASWSVAQMLQSVRPTSREVHGERYRGLPLRKVLIDAKRRLTYFVLRDLLVAGTGEAWVKQSLDLALGEPGHSVLEQDAVREALASHRPAVAVVDVEALQQEPGKPGLAELALTQLRWLRAEVDSRGELVLAAAPEGAAPSAAPTSPQLLRFAPKSTALAISRRIDLRSAVTRLLQPPPPTGAPDAGTPNAAPEVDTLRAELLATVVPALGEEAFWLADRLEPGAAEHSGTRHLIGLQVRDPAALERAMEPLVPKLLAPPLHRATLQGYPAVCGGPDRSLCLAQAGPVLLVSTSSALLEAALESSDASAAPLGWMTGAGADLFYADGARLASALGHTEPAGAVLTAMRGVGAVVGSLRPVRAGAPAGEVRAR